MALIGHQPDGATPLDADDLAALRPKHVTTREQLNELEQDNILRAQSRVLGVRPGPRPALLTERDVRRVHQLMFDRVWKWAGRYRLSDKNIGMSWHEIPVDVQNLCDDAQYWIANQTYPIDEIATRFHHRLVRIHPFPDGNGRHARLMTDALLERLGHRRFNWGDGDLNRAGDIRGRYIAALRAADAGEMGALLTFVRS